MKRERKYIDEQQLESMSQELLNLTRYYRDVYLEKGFDQEYAVFSAFASDLEERTRRLKTMVSNKYDLLAEQDAQH